MELCPYGLQINIKRKVLKLGAHFVYLLHFQKK